MALASPKQFLNIPTAGAAPTGNHRSVPSARGLCGAPCAASGGGDSEGHFSFGMVRICAPDARAALTRVTSACGLRTLSSSRKTKNTPRACRAAALRAAPRYRAGRRSNVQRPETNSGHRARASRAASAPAVAEPSSTTTASIWPGESVCRRTESSAWNRSGPRSW
eukprot:scaffold14233_cov148-Isochrysis_galbana.AAC.1